MRRRKLPADDLMIRAAARAILLRGFPGCTTRLVADQAGVSLEQVRRQFPRRECLVTAVVGRAAGLFNMPLASPANADTDRKRLTEHARDGDGRPRSAPAAARGAARQQSSGEHSRPILNASSKTRCGPRAMCHEERDPRFSPPLFRVWSLRRRPPIEKEGVGDAHDEERGIFDAPVANLRLRATEAHERTVFELPAPASARTCIHLDEGESFGRPRAAVLDHLDWRC